MFTKIGPPGQPEPVAIGPDGRVYVGTNQLGHGDADAPSKVFAFSQKAKLVREYEIEGQPLEEDHGIQGLVFDRDGLLYALDRSADPRVVVLDPATGKQRVYARFRDVPPCAGEPDGECSATQLDGPAGPDYAVFAPNGDLYVTDIDQALIWRVPKGGGKAEIWLTDPRFESLYGPNGIQFMADGRTLLFVNTASNPNAGNSLTGRLYTVPVQPDGSPGELTQVWESLPLDAPDGLAIAQSGNVYIALAGTSQILMLSPEFAELARTPPDPASNQAEEVPVDSPGKPGVPGRPPARLEPLGDPRRPGQLGDPRRVRRRARAAAPLPADLPAEAAPEGAPEPPRQPRAGARHALPRRAEGPGQASAGAGARRAGAYEQAGEGHAGAAPRGRSPAPRARSQAGLLPRRRHARRQRRLPVTR